MLEMRVEAQLVRRTDPSSLSTAGGGVNVYPGGDLKPTSANIRAEFKSWTRLFNRKFIDRTWIGILMMVFQRESSSPYFNTPNHRFCIPQPVKAHGTYFLLAPRRVSHAPPIIRL